MHIHVKVHVGGDKVHTGQLFFRDGLTRRRLQAGALQGARPARHAQRRRPIYGSGGSRSLLAMRPAGKGYVGSISMGVRRS